MAFTIILTDSTNPIGQALLNQFEQNSFRVILPAEKSVNWQDAQSVDEYFTEHMPDLVVNTLGWSDTGVGVSEAKLLEPALNIADVCRRIDAVPIQLSSYRVFGGEKSGYIETDITDPRDSVGELFLDVERAYAELPKHIILRLSWVMGWQGENLLTRLLRPLTGHGQARINAEWRGAPITHSDIARVIIAIIKQVQYGSENWGIFHYGSSDVCTEDEFAREVCARLMDRDLLNGDLVHVDRAESDPVSAAVGYRRIMDCFGVQPRTWHQGLGNMISTWLAENTQNQGVAS
ncbi:sugar nucleotide-binding protein [Marinibactrum halimedae]|uniref:dTDP-4-dehydrorhamnose reductase n=1 Tax=Marinibactrum halimedae TaxID=1444977 RepID=A0AA37T0V3_9GAMM|nr:sugar nucleotide-binding protein [Marinibactrum halimedae]MCD9457786.1 NAD(P)-dependent oxidoreductase [Marinibactrum halimedae]GLS24840.1 NAD(P)-dependent oxidoreductase [Marinibactrum halimedae]